MGRSPSLDSAECWPTVPAILNGVPAANGHCATDVVRSNGQPASLPADILPISVVIPTRNSMSYLPAHVEVMTQWASLVEEIIVVDSESDDGTPDYLRCQLRHPNLRVLSHPPGLYESWNYAITQVTSKYTYIATVGDQIERHGLVHLYETAERLGCDVCMSPPRLLDMRGRRIGQRWPIHAVIEELKIASPRNLAPAEAVFYAVTSGTSALLGSSASNLYRTRYMQTRPFPSDFDTAGDTAWGLANCCDATFGVTPYSCSTFLVHPKTPPADVELLAKRISELARKVFQRAMTEYPQVKAARKTVLLSDFLAETERYRAHQRYLDTFRERRLPWIFNWRAWQARFSRERHRRRARWLKGQCLGSSGTAPVSKK